MALLLARKVVARPALELTGFIKSSVHGSKHNIQCCLPATVSEFDLSSAIFIQFPGTHGLRFDNLWHVMDQIEQCIRVLVGFFQDSR